MKRYLSTLICSFLLVTASFAQIAPIKYFIQFTDKNNSPYNLSNPLDFLSQKSLNRRANQGYVLDNRDLPVNPSYIDSVLAAGNVSLLTKSKWLNGITIFTDDSIALDNINALTFVQSVQAVSPFNTNKKEYIPDDGNDEYLKKTSKNNFKSVTSYNYGYSANQIEMIGLDFLHNQGYNGHEITIAVLDAGFYSVDTMAVFDSLWNDNRILGTRDFVNWGSNVFEEHTHGMMVLSLMAANVPGQIIGTAPKASYWLLRSEDAPTEYIIEEYNWVSAAEFADSIGADIINSSLGYSEFDEPSQNHVFADLDGSTTVISKGANAAASRGILVVNSAGNSAQTSWQRIIAPSDADSVLTIGAVDENVIYAPFSSVGYTADGRVKPDVVSQGANTVVASAQGGIMTGNGTSFSSPIIAGAMACLWQANPNASNIQLMNAVKQSASQYNSPDSLLGYGIPNFAVAHMLLSGVAIDESSKDDFLSIFPNPFQNNFSLIYNATDTQAINLELYDYNGKILFSMFNIGTDVGYNNITIDNLNNIKKGIYFLKITKHSAVTIVKKLVKIS